MFDNIEKRATALCIGIPVAIIILGRTFGGSLWGLIPLAVCITSGVWLWMQEVIRSGRDMEWSSEQLRGEMVGSLSCVHFVSHNTDSQLGYCQPASRVRRVAE
jgi:fatty acid desaturase